MKLRSLLLGSYMALGLVPTAFGKTIIIPLNDNRQITLKAGSPNNLDEVMVGSAEETFKAIINHGNKSEGGTKVIVDFWASWCGPCRTMGNTLHTIAPQYPDIIILKVNTDNPQFDFLNNRFQIRSLPTLLFFQNGKIVHRQTGAMNANNFTALINGTFV